MVRRRSKALFQSPSPGIGSQSSPDGVMQESMAARDRAAVHRRGTTWGTMLRVRCRRCGGVSDQLDGAVFMGFRPRCTTCGKARLVSIEDLVDTDPPGLEPGSPEAWQSRHQRIPALAGVCECGGEFSEDAPIRCPECRSTDVSTDLVGFAD
jgi:hypothetical protein